MDPWAQTLIWTSSGSSDMNRRLFNIAVRHANPISSQVIIDGWGVVSDRDTCFGSSDISPF